MVLRPVCLSAYRGPHSISNKPTASFSWPSLPALHSGMPGEFNKQPPSRVTQKSFEFSPRFFLFSVPPLEIFVSFPTSIVFASLWSRRVVRIWSLKQKL